MRAFLASPFRPALLAGWATLGAFLCAAQPAAAQVALFWNGWSSAPPDEYIDDAFIPRRVVVRILGSRGYRLTAPPRLTGERIVAIGENARGRRMRFVIDGYSGELLRQTTLRPPALRNGETFARRQAPGLDDGPDERFDAPDDRFDRPAEHRARPKAKAKPKAKPQTAARGPGSGKTLDAAKPAAKKGANPPAPSQATKAPPAPSPAEKPAKAKEAPATPQQAAAPTTPAPEEKPPLTPEAAPAAPADIGPRVQPVAPQEPAAAPQASTSGTTPAGSNPAPSDTAQKSIP
ncbi:MAG: hypothetical protein ACK5JM_14965 [Rhodoblastus sp.]